MSSPEKLKRIRLELPRLERRKAAEGLHLAWPASQRRDALVHHSSGDHQIHPPSAGPCGGQSSVIVGAVDGPQGPSFNVSSTWSIIMGRKCY